MRFLIVAFLSFLLVLPTQAGKPKPFDPFQGFDPKDVEIAAVGAISIPNPNLSNGDGTYAEICSGSVIGYGSDGNALFLTAKHCVWDGDEENDGANPQFIQGEVVSFNKNLDGPYYKTELVEVSQDDDLALLRVFNCHVIPEVFEDENTLQPGDPVENVSFPLDMGKMEFHGQFVAPILPHFPRWLQPYPQWKKTMPVDITIGHGSSGSPLFDSKTHKMIGVMVGTSGEARLMLAEPFTAIADMLLHPDKNSVSNWIGSHLPKTRFHIPQ